MRSSSPHYEPESSPDEDWAPALAERANALLQVLGSLRGAYGRLRAHMLD